MPQSGPGVADRHSPATPTVIITDLLPLAHRGPAYGLIGLTWGLAAAGGPPVGGALASSGNWRWLFYLNVPVSCVALVLVYLFLNVKTPRSSWREKAAKMDYANLLCAAASTSTVYALSTGGVEHAWTSAQVLAPLVLGLAGLGAFLWVEKRWVAHPTVPFDILSNRNSLCGFLATFIHGIMVTALVYYLPSFFQACKGSSAVASGIQSFSLSFSVPIAAIIAGVSVTVTKHYLVQNYLGWVILIVGLGLMTLIRASSPAVVFVCFPVVAGLGLGALSTAARFPILAPLAPAQHPAAMSFFQFSRALGQVFGITVGSTVLTNRLARTLPAQFLAEFGASEAAIPYIKGLPEPLRAEVRVAFASSLQTVWYVILGVAFVGLLATCGLRSVPMTVVKDEQWGLEGEAGSQESFGEVAEAKVTRPVMRERAGTSSSLASWDFEIKLA